MMRSRLALLISVAAFAAATVSSADAGGMFMGSTRPTLCLPQSSLRAGYALSPAAIARRLSARRFRINAMYRRGPAYAVKAVGPSGNQVEMMVDGRSGEIIGLNIVKAVTAIALAINNMNAQKASFIDDRHPFGAVVPEVVYAHWQGYQQAQWEAQMAARQQQEDMIQVEQTFSPYAAAVPYYYMHVNPRSGYSFAVAPPTYRGYALADYSGRSLAYSETRADLAERRAEIESVRASNADYQRAMAQENALAANGRADVLEQQNEQLADIAGRESQRANSAEAEAQEAERRLQQQGEANQEVTSGQADEAITADNTNGQVSTPLDAPPPPEAIAPSDSGGGSDAGQNGGEQQEVAPQEQGGGEQQQVAPQEQGGGEQQQEVAPQEQGGGEQRQEVAPQEQGGGEQQQEVAPQEQGAGEQQQEVAPQEQGGGEQQQAAPQEQGGGEQQQEAAPQEQGGGEQQQESAPQDQGGGEQSNGGEQQGGGDGN